MLRIFLSIMACTLCLTVVYPQVKVGENPLEIDEASLIEIESTSKGFLPSRMTTAQRDLQTAWKLGHIIYNTTESCLQIYSGTTWDCFIKGEIIDSTIYKYNGILTSDRVMTLNGNSFFFDAAGATDVIIQPDGDVGIGTTTPNARLDVENGTVRFSDYGDGMIGGTAGYVLGVDVDGDIIEVPYNYVNQTIDSLFIRNDSLLISLEEDGEDFQKLDLSNYLNTDNQDLSLSGNILSLTNDPTTVNLSQYAIDSSIYKYNGVLPEARMLDLGGYNLTFSGTNNVTFESSGELGLGEDSPDAPLHITETIGTSASANDGTVIIQHNNSGGSSSLVFKSAVNSGSDFAYLQYDDDGSGNGSTSENSLFTIGIGNDGAGANQDDIALLPSGYLGIGTISPGAKLDVAGGNVRFSNYGGGSIGLNTQQFLLGVNTDGDIVEVAASSLGSDDQEIDSIGLTGTNLEISIEDDVNGLQSVDLSSLQGGSVDLHDDVDVSTTLPTPGDVLSWDGSNFVPQATDNGYTIFNIWAEESAGLNNTATEWSFGNGDETPTGHGIIIPIDCELWALTLDHENGVNTTVRVIQNANTGLSSYEVSTTGAEQAYNVFGSTLAFSAGDVLNFRTISASAAGTSGRVSAWFRIRATPASNSLLEDLMDVSATSISSGQVLVYNGASFVPGDNSDDQNLSNRGKIGNNQTIDIEDGNSVIFSVADADSSLTNEIQTVDFLDLTGTTLSVSLDNDGEAPVTVDLSGLQDGTGSDDQNLSNGGKIGNSQTIDIEDGNSIIFSVADADSSTTNEIQDLTLSGNTLAISDDPNTDVDLSPYLDDTNLTQEEVQDFVGSMVTGNTETGISVEYDDANNEFDFIAVDASETNEIQTIDSFALTGTSIALSLENDGENPLTLDLSSLQDGTGSDDQDLSNGGKTGNSQTIDIEDGNSVTFSIADADSSTTNEIQTVDQLSLSGTDLLLSLENDGVPAESVDLSDLLGPWDNLDTSPATQLSTDINYPGGNVGINDADPSERLQVNGNIEAGDDGAGTVALTINDGQGNANVTFNHTRGVPDNNGSSARIVSGVDATTGYLGFEVESNVTAGVSVNTTELMRIQDTGQIRFHEYGDGDFDDSSPSRLLGSTTAGQIVEYDLSNITDDQVIDSFALNGTTLELSLENDGVIPLSVDLSSLQDGTGSDDQTLTYTNTNVDDNINTLQIEGSSAINIDDNHLGTNDQTLTATRTVGLSGNSLTFDGSARDMIINSLGNVGMGIPSPERPLHIDEALRISRGANSTSFIFDRWDGTIANTWASAGFFLESSSAGTGEFFITNYRQNVSGSPVPGKALSIDLATDQIAFPQYGDGTFDDSAPARLLGVNTNGDLLEVTPISIDSFALTGNSLAISLENDGVDPLTVDFSTILGSTDNIYNANGTLTGNREVIQNNFDLNFDANTLVVSGNDNRVGIGLTDPNYKFQLLETNAIASISTTSESTDATLFLGTPNNGATGAQKTAIIAEGLSNWSRAKLHFALDDSSGDNTAAANATIADSKMTIEYNGEVGIGTTDPQARLDVAGGSVRFSEYGDGTYADTTNVDYILTANTSGDIKELNTAKNTRWFYPPAVIIDASDLDTMATLDIYEDYRSQFSTPLISSDGASGFVPYYQKGELEYYITYYDNSILDNISIDSDGVMTYDIISVPFDNYTVINVVFVIKDP